MNERTARLWNDLEATRNETENHEAKGRLLKMLETGWHANGERGDILYSVRVTSRQPLGRLATYLSQPSLTAELNEYVPRSGNFGAQKTNFFMRFESGELTEVRAAAYEAHVPAEWQPLEPQMTPEGALSDAAAILDSVDFH